MNSSIWTAGAPKKMSSTLFSDEKLESPEPLISKGIYSLWPGSASEVYVGGSPERTFRLLDAPRRLQNTARKMANILNL
jgi:hypothetical protein